MKLTGYLIALSMLFWFPSCGNDHEGHDHEAEGHDHETENHEGHEHDGHHHEGEEGDHASDEIILSPEMAKRMGVETMILKPSTFHEVVNVSGQILTSPSDVAVAVAPAAGIVKLNASLKPGDAVSQGASIARIETGAVTGGSADKIGQQAIEAAKRELDRAKPLHAEGLITTRELNELQSAYDAAVAAYSPKAAGGIVSAPLGGVVTSVLVQQGEYVEAGQPIAQISKNTSLTLRADLPERYYSFLPMIQSATFRSAGGNDYIAIEELGGKISSGASMSTSSAGYYPIFFTIGNRGDIVPGAFAEINLLGAKRADVLTVPVTALTEQLGEFYVYVKLDEEGYQRRLVKTGGSDGINVEILSGINPGEEIVKEGATVIRLAENTGKVPEGHTHNH